MEALTRAKLVANLGQGSLAIVGPSLISSYPVCVRVCFYIAIVVRSLGLAKCRVGPMDGVCSGLVMGKCRNGDNCSRSYIIRPGQH